MRKRDKTEHEMDALTETLDMWRARGSAVHALIEALADVETACSRGDTELVSAAWESVEVLFERASDEFCDRLYKTLVAMREEASCLCGDC